MSQYRIGEILSHLVPLSDHDVEEILQEQKATRQRFGDAAISLGFARPQHVWQAWMKQIDGDSVTIDLDALGVDTQAAAVLSEHVARELRVVAVRMSNEEVLIASVQPLSRETVAELSGHTGRHVITAFASAEQIDRMIEFVYSSSFAGSAVSTAA